MIDKQLRHHLVGVASFVTKNDCSGIPVFARVSAALHWIKGHMGEKPDPPGPEEFTIPPTQGTQSYSILYLIVCYTVNR